MALPNIGPIEAYSASVTGPFETVEELVDVYVEGTVVDVPLAFIDREEVPVDEEHVSELAASMDEEAHRHGGSGQLTALNLAHVPGREKLAIIDGFHRDGGLDRLGRSTGKATIRLNTSEEELADLRVLAANMHKSVSFARQVSWVEQVWAATPWASEDLTAAKAFALASGKLAGSRYGLRAEQVTAITQWVTNKSRKWGVAISTMHNNLLVAQAAAPELVAEARGRVNGRNLEALTPQHLGVIARGLPYDYPFQLLAAGVAKQHALTVPQTRTLVKKLSPIHNFERAQQLVSGIDWSQAGSTYSPSRERERRRESTPRVSAPSEQEATTSFLLDEVLLAKLSIENVVLKGRYVAPPLEGGRTGNIFGLSADVAIKEFTMSPAAIAKNVERTRVRVQRIQDTAKEFLVDTFGCSLREAYEAINMAQDRVITDMQKGASRFVEFTDDRQFDLLVLASARDILGREGLHKSGSNVIDMESRREHQIMKGATLADALPRLTYNERQALILTTVFNLSSFAIGQVMHRRPAEVEQIVTSAVLVTRSA